MANPEHLEILKQGVEVWNKWRETHHEVVPQLRDAHLSGATLSGANFSVTGISAANLSHANLSNTNLIGANFSATNLSYANLSGAIVNGADFNFSKMSHTTLADIDLSKAKGLETVRHFNPSTIGIDTIYKSRGNIPEIFLRGCGVPESFIVQMHALVASTEPIQFYTCFISFTEDDNAFSERLYNDLQMKGVRCWRWKEDAKWGKTLMHSIDEAVRLYDKLIIICSEQSLNSPAVIREIERALQKEDDLARQGKEGEVLFPIRLDDYIFTGWNHHRKADVIAKNVGDFRQWKDHDSYSKAFDRLLRDLKAEDKQTAKG